MTTKQLAKRSLINRWYRIILNGGTRRGILIGNCAFCREGIRLYPGWSSIYCDYECGFREYCGRLYREWMLDDSMVSALEIVKAIESIGEFTYSERRDMWEYTIKKLQKEKGE